MFWGSCKAAFFFECYQGKNKGKFGFKKTKSQSTPISKNLQITLYFELVTQAGT